MDDTSSDEDPGDGEGDNKIVKRDILQHQEQLQALKSQDPEFYEYLEQADQKLLAFGDEDEDVYSEVCVVTHCRTSRKHILKLVSSRMNQESTL